jgi:hypothetical protein
MLAAFNGRKGRKAVTVNDATAGKQVPLLSCHSVLELLT